MTLRWLARCGVALLLIVGAASAWYATAQRAAPVPAAASPPATPVPRPPGPPEKPHIVITTNHELARVQHKDISGRVPIELVQTPEGVVTIHRTFRLDGVLMKEEATLNGQPVPLPPPAPPGSAAERPAHP